MAIENLQENIITDVAIGATGIIKEAIMEFVKRYKIPLLIIAAVIIIWIIYTISKSISNYLMRRRIQRIDMNVQEIMSDEPTTIPAKRTTKYCHLIFDKYFMRD